MHQRPLGPRDEQNKGGGVMATPGNDLDHIDSHLGAIHLIAEIQSEVKYV